jgi:hypothetical protein
MEDELLVYVCNVMTRYRVIEEIWGRFMAELKRHCGFEFLYSLGKL